MAMYEKYDCTGLKVEMGIVNSGDFEAFTIEADIAKMVQSQGVLFHDSGQF
jgi:hypothetical protein